MDTAIAIASKRDLRRYSETPLPAEAVEWILECGRIAGSGKNRQARRFVVLSDLLLEATEFITRPDNVRGASLAIAIVTPNGSYSGFDAGRAAQNMMLAAWAKGIASCPNAIADSDAIGTLLGLTEDETVAIVISFGLPLHSFDTDRRCAAEWIHSADRLPLKEIVEYR